MDALTAAVLSVSMERQAVLQNANAALLREAKRSDAAVLQLLDAAKALEQSSAGTQHATGGSSAGGRGSILNIIA